jgi:uncharacterized repeat protein (TIGR01451 family)
MRGPLESDVLHTGAQRLNRMLQVTKKHYQTSHLGVKAMKAIVKFLGLALMLAAAPLHAQQSPGSIAGGGPIDVRLESRKVVPAADGKETLVPATTAKPGDVIEYSATYRNTSRQAIGGLEATIPIPGNTEFVPGSAQPAGAKASLDSRSWADMPLKRKVRRDGREVEEQVPFREYRYLRWFPGELGGDKSMTFTARVRVVE